MPAEPGPLTMRCAVLGDPIEHSLSPALHRAAYDDLGLAGWSYDAIRVPAGGLAEFVGGLGGPWPPSPWRGLSVTMPLKREAHALADSLSPRARLAGSVNTLVRTSTGWAGDNTDLAGAVAAVRERTGAEITRGAILGAGATAASTGLALVELGARSVTLLARDVTRAREALSVIAGHPAAPQVSVLPLEAHPEAEILVSTVPARAQTPGLVDRWRDVPVLFEVVYDPWPTPLAAAATGTVVTGLDLLAHQAVAQFELYTSRTPDLEVMRRAGRRALGVERAEESVPPG
ncbi:MAG: shikimate dehydrogenase [Nocardioides sp.]|uniref:shikimate dehydrogenase n=1 Tax=Nocardioides sp. TaxID=35761 RepID=UPI0039E5ECA0